MSRVHKRVLKLVNFLVQNLLKPYIFIWGHIVPEYMMPCGQLAVRGPPDNSLKLYGASAPMCQVPSIREVLKVKHQETFWNWELSPRTNLIWDHYSIMGT